MKTLKYKVKEIPGVPPPESLTIEEEFEMQRLSNELFKGSMFAVFGQRTPEIARYDHLMSKKLTYLNYFLNQLPAYIDGLARRN